MSRQKKFYFLISAIYSLAVIIIVGAEVGAFAQLSSIQGSYKEAAYRNDNLTEKIDYLELLSVRYKNVKTEIPNINTALPGEKDASKLLSDLDSLATGSGLKLVLLQSTTYGKKQQVASDKSLLQTITGKYGNEMPLDIKVEGSYNNFLVFIKRLENYQRMVDVSSIEITKVIEDGAAPDQIEVKLKLTAYLKK